MPPINYRRWIVCKRYSKNQIVHVAGKLEIYTMNQKTDIPLDFNRISKAIDYLYTNYRAQPTLEQVAEAVHLSPFHFQRMFTAWAGVSPKKFLQFVSIQKAKQKLRKEESNLFTTTHETGLSSSSRLHDLFVKIEAMTPGEYKKGALSLHYQTGETDFGKVLIAATNKGICHVAFYDDFQLAWDELSYLFPRAELTLGSNKSIEQLLLFFAKQTCSNINLHLRGTSFQLKVWSALLQIPHGQLTNYAQIADQIDTPNSSRAVGTAIGSNPIAFLIPCHRVIRSTGIIEEYRWGRGRKIAMIGKESLDA